MPNRFLNKLPAYRRHKPSGQAVVTLSGRDYYLGPWKSAKSRRRYKLLVSRWQRGAVADEDGQTHDHTVIELLAAFKRHAKQHYGPDAREYATYVTLAKQLAAMFGRRPARKFDALKLQEFRDWLVERGLARTTVNHQVNRVRKIFKWAVSQKLVRVRVYLELKCVDGLRFGRSGAKETEPVQPVADAAVDATLPYLAPQVRAMVELQRTTGMRSGEVTIMRTCDINTSGNVWTYIPAHHKNTHRGHQRIVYLGPKAQEILRPWLRVSMDEYLFRPSEVDQWRREQRAANRKTPITYGNRAGTNRVRRPKRKAGDCYTAGTYGKAVMYACQLAFGMPMELRKGRKGESDEQRQARQAAAAEWRRQHGWHPHQLRHRFATDARDEFDIETARILCGHKHASTTEIYAKASHRKALEVAAKIG